MIFRDSPCFMGSAEGTWIPKIRELLVKGSVIDLCGGSGRFYEAFRGHPYTCIDINQELVATGKKLYPDGEWLCTDVNDIKWKHYDNVFSWVGLQHVKDIEALAKKIMAHTDNFICCEGTEPVESDYQFYHDWDRLFPGIKKIESISGPAWLMHWRRKWDS
jgi:ubiquinone/menaquinone biosynthesis C-methylase UbiE